MAGFARRRRRWFGLRDLRLLPSRQPDTRIAAPRQRSGPSPVSGVRIEVLAVGNDVGVESERGVGEGGTFGAVWVVVAADKPGRGRRRRRCGRILMHLRECRDLIVVPQHIRARRRDEQDPVHVFVCGEPCSAVQPERDSERVSDDYSLSSTELGELCAYEVGPSVQ